MSIVKLLRVLYRCIRFVLFQFDPEKIHDMISGFIKVLGFLIRNGSGQNKLLKITLCNQFLNCPMVMAAGFDKNGDLVNGLHSFGFGLTEVGTFTKKSQAGNPKPRLFRITSHHALFNRMGFNNHGIEKGLDKLAKSRYPFAISIGKSKETPVEQAVEDYIEILETIEHLRYTDLRKKIVYIAINVSSPNTPGLRLLQNKKYIKDLIVKCKQVSELPLFVKFSPDFSSMKEFETTLAAALEAGVNGVIVTNTSSDEALTQCVPEAIRKAGGGLSGLPVTEKSEKYLTSALKLCRGVIPVLSSGGIMSPEDVWKRLEMGASAVQIYTGFIYNGPGFIKESIDYVENKLQQGGFQSLSDYQRRTHLKNRKVQKK